MLFANLFFLFTFVSITTIVSLDWLEDDSFSTVTIDHCDFPIYNARQLNLIDINVHSPYVVRNLTNDWPAILNWRKDSLLTAFGSRVVRSGSESSIVHSGGVAEQESTLKDMIENMSSEIEGNSFIFDTTVLDVIPELNDDFTVPDLFRDWDNEANETRSAMWHMLSLGPSKSGLSFHNHGRTWLAVVHGIKQWFIYPPGFDPPQSIDGSFSPMLPVLRWIEEVYAKLLNFPKPPLLNSSHPSSQCTPVTEYPTYGFRPLECRQHPGDILFLPSRWSHMTINIGETIAIGGQESLMDDIRYNHAIEILEEYPQNYDAWKDLGLAQFNKANVQLLDLRNLVELPGPGQLVHLSGPLERMDYMLESTRDTWLVLYYDSLLLEANQTMHEDFQRVVAAAWMAIAQELRDSINVAAFDLKGNYTEIPTLSQRLDQDWQRILQDNTAICVTELTENLPMYKVDYTHQYLTLPVAKLHRGECSSSKRRKNFIPDYTGIDLVDTDITDTQAMVSRINKERKQLDLAEGSLGTVPVYIQSLYREALSNLKQALKIKPLQPELLNLVGEVAGLARDLDSMHAALRRNIEIVDDLADQGLAAISLASMYHKIGHNYIKMRMGEDALLPVQKSLQALPSFLPAMYDHVFIYVLRNDRNAAEYTLEQLRLVVQDFQNDQNAMQLEEQVNSMLW